MTYSKKLVKSVVVTYNPDIKLLTRNLDSLTQQVSSVFLYDNASKNRDEIIELVKNFPTVKLFLNDENLGLPINYNRATTEAKCGGGCEWLLTMDQDSQLPNDYIECASRYFIQDDIAIICPLERDDDITPANESHEEACEFVERCISSGSLNRISTLEALGGFDEKMFIDMVDFDYCKTVRERGHKILRLNNCIMKHKIGRCEIISVFGKPKMIFNHSPLRRYYYFRNSIYYARKHAITFKKDKQFYMALMKGLILILYEKNGVRKFFMGLKGLLAGFRMKLPRCYTSNSLNQERKLIS